MKKICKVRPSGFECYMCMETADSCDRVPDCWNCMYDKPCELISVGTSFWSGDYAMVICDGQIEKVALNRIYDVEEEA